MEGWRKGVRITQVTVKLPSELPYTIPLVWPPRLLGYWGGLISGLFRGAWIRGGHITASSWFTASI